MSLKRIFFYILLAVFSIAFLAGARYVYKKKFVKIPTMQPEANNILNFDTKDIYLNNKRVIFVDFENYQKKEELYEKEAFSGKYSYKVFGKNSFSVVITKPVSEIGKENLGRAGISAYVYIFPEDFSTLDAQLVFAIVDPKGNNVAWNNVAMKSVFMKAGKWTKISGAFDIDINTISNDCVIKTYVWNSSKTKILVDDILVVLGKDQPFKGDTTYCDNTIENGWKKAFNYPPFPYQYLFCHEINNEHSEYLIKNKTKTTGQLFPDTKICTGNFYDEANQKDKIIAVEGNNLNAYSYYEPNKAFSNDLTMVLSKKDTLWHTANYYSAKFRGRQNDEILLADAVSKNIILYAITNLSGHAFPSKPAEMKLNTLWEGTYKNFDMKGALPVYFSTPCLGNLQKAKLLTVYSDGNWQLFEFQNTDWKAIAQSKKPVNEWVDANYNYNLVYGRFLAKTNNNLILSVSTSKKDNKSVYSLLSYNEENKNLIEIYSSQKSKVWGLDTLKAADNLMVLRGISKTESILRLDNEWRFDLKHIAFNDTTFQILSTIDFKGYKNDYNPKFYEIVHLIPGCFIEKNKTSFLTLCYNCKNGNLHDSNCKQYINHSFLPNTLSVFTFNNDAK